MRRFHFPFVTTSLFLAIMAAGVPMLRASRALAASLPEDDLRGCAAYAPRHLARTADFMTPYLSGAALALLPLPSETAKIVCAWIETAAASGQMSRRDTLWFQAGYGGLPGGALAPDAPAFPAWESANPTIFRVSPGRGGTIDPNPFAPPPPQ